MQRTLQRELKVPEASAGTAEIDAVTVELQAPWPAEGGVSLRVFERGTALRLRHGLPRQPSSPGPTSRLIAEPCPQGLEDHRDSHW